MKARRKSDGKIIEVETYMLNSRRGNDGSWESSYKDIKSGFVYEASELLFNLDYYTVIQGWVARDWNGALFIYTHKPSRIPPQTIWHGELAIEAELSTDLFPGLTWESDPIKVRISIIRE